MLGGDGVGEGMLGGVEVGEGGDGVGGWGR